MIITFLALFTFASGAHGVVEGERVERAEFGAISHQPELGRVIVAVDTMPADLVVKLPTPIEHAAGAYIDEPGRIGPGKMPRVSISYSGGAMRLHPPAEAGKACVIVVETAANSQQHPDGRISFTAGDAKVIPAAGREKSEAKLDVEGANQRIRFWSVMEETISWEWTATRPGMYDIELTYALSEKPCKLRASIDEVHVEAELKRVGSVDTYLPVTLGKVYVKSPGKHTLTLRTLERERFGIRVKAVLLRPTGEGQPLKQGDDGVILLHSRDVTARGTKVQYEPKPEKNTVGYWVNESDRVSWTFAATAPGTFEVEILQGCGKGQGGSEVALSLLEKTGFGNDQTLKFIVEDTGHFQNFIPRTIGKFTIATPGEYTIEVRPLKKAKAAVMDLRQVKLTPVKAEK